MMAVLAPYVYMVRCRFSGDGDYEEKWNRWYSGPKMEMMLEMPFFLTGQRFRSVDSTTEVPYLAVWGLESPKAFETPEYRALWGFAEWADYIQDWSRDLYQVRSGPTALVVQSGERLTASAFSQGGVDPSVLPDASWLDPVGLDKTWPLVALELSGDEHSGAIDIDRRDLVAWRTHYEPIPAGREFGLSSQLGPGEI